MQSRTLIATLAAPILLAAGSSAGCASTVVEPLDPAASFAVLSLEFET